MAEAPSPPTVVAASSRRLLAIVRILIVNAAVLGLLLAGVELVFGNWLRPLTLHDLRRFSIPVDVQYSFQPQTLYETSKAVGTYTRDRWGLRGDAKNPATVDVLTVGGSTTDQRYLDDTDTWQAVAQRVLAAEGQPVQIANAGVDGQSTVGHVFNFRFWFPLLPDLKPKVVLFYVGINDVLRGGDRDDYDRAVDATSWRTRSALFQIYKTVRGNARARAVGVSHGRFDRPADDFTDVGLLTAEQRLALADRVTSGLLDRVKVLSDASREWHARPVFVTQTALAWNADGQPPRGLRDRVRLHDVDANFADVAFVHQRLNRALMEHCRRISLTCFDLALELDLDRADYYDSLHNTPTGAVKIGRYIAEHLRATGVLQDGEVAR